jgi:hypothetical protein
MENAMCNLLLIAVLIVGATPASSYVLQGRHVLDLMIERLGPANSLFVSEKLIVYRLPADAAEDDISATPATGESTAINPAVVVPEFSSPESTEPEALEMDGTLRYIFSRAFRSDIRSSDSERIRVAVGGRTLTVIDGRIVSDAPNRFDSFKEVLLHRTRARLGDSLLGLGVDISISSLGRFDDRVAFVLGAYYPDDDANQLWVDKDSLLPMRLILRDTGIAGSSEKAEIRYLTWWKIGETQYPSRIEFYQDDNLVRVSQAKNFEENPTFSGELFDIDYLQTVYPRATLQPVATESAEEPSEIQKTIENFKRIFD